MNDAEKRELADLHLKVVHLYNLHRGMVETQERVSIVVGIIGALAVAEAVVIAVKLLA